MQILALVASHRKLGNTEVMVREALLAAAAEGASWELVRLSDLKILPCTGCMACVFRPEVGCHLEDDMEMLLSKMRQADGLILGAPTYILAPAGIVKMFLDRSIMTFQHRKDYEGKAAIVIAIAGLPRWEPLSLPLLTTTVLAYGYRLVDAMMAYSPGPGETLLDPNNIQRAALAGRRLLQALKGQALEPFWEPNTCPVCRARFFSLTDNGIECPLCHAQGRLVQRDGKMVAEFFPQQPEHRWTPEEARRHLHEWILPSGPRFQARRKEIEALKAKYREMQLQVQGVGDRS